MRSLRLGPAALLALAACGGGGAGGTSLFVHETTLAPYQEYGLPGPDELPVFPGFLVGEELTFFSFYHRGFCRFDVTALPAGAQIESATLRVERTSVQGDPGTLGVIRIDDVAGEGQFLFGPTAYNGPALVTGFTTLDPPDVVVPNLPVHYTADVTGRLQAALDAPRTRFNLRMRFDLDSNGDLLSDYLSFDRQSGLHATLEVRWSEP
jgi:hypothetical protein